MNLYNCRCFGTWLSRCTNMRPERRKELAAITTKAKKICEEWESIVRNLTDPRLTHVDARRFTIRQFYEARCIDYCLEQQRINSPKDQTKPNSQEFLEAKYQEIKNKILETDILGDVSYSEDQAKILINRLKKDIKRMCQTYMIAYFFN